MAFAFGVSTPDVLAVVDWTIETVRAPKLRRPPLCPTRGRRLLHARPAGHFRLYKTTHKDDSDRIDGRCDEEVGLQGLPESIL